LFLTASLMGGTHLTYPLLQGWTSRFPQLPITPNFAPCTNPFPFLYGHFFQAKYPFLQDSGMPLVSVNPGRLFSEWPYYFIHRTRVPFPCIEYAPAFSFMPCSWLWHKVAAWSLRVSLGELNCHVRHPAFPRSPYQRCCVRMLWSATLAEQPVNKHQVLGMRCSLGYPVPAAIRQHLHGRPWVTIPNQALPGLLSHEVMRQQCCVAVSLSFGLICYMLVVTTTISFNIGNIVPLNLCWAL
jgi:hypothetical protein